jgi:3-oxoacyl-[acyl-carrier protein] reductase
MNFKDKVAVITGSATGIGAATAHAFARAGAKVVINYRKSEREAIATSRQCAELSAAIIVQGDVAKDEDCQKIAEAALAQWGRIDILVNNAGTTKFNAHAKLEGLSAEDFQMIFGVNVVGPYQMIKACAPAMKAQGKGVIVNVSSIAGIFGAGSSVAYTASKGALNTLTLSLARALAPEIRVNAVCPGFVGTRWFSERLGPELFQKAVAHQQATTPLKRAGAPEDIADVILFFASDHARHVTGETLLVDAGAHLEITPVQTTR